MEKYDLCKVEGTRSATIITCTDSVLLTELGSELITIVPGIDIRSFDSDKLPTNETCSIRIIHPKAKVESNYLWWVLKYLGENGWKPIAHDYDYGVERSYHFSRMKHE